MAKTTSPSPIPPWWALLLGGAAGAVGGLYLSHAAHIPVEDGGGPMLNGAMMGGFALCGVGAAYLVAPNAKEPRR